MEWFLLITKAVLVGFSVGNFAMILHARRCIKNMENLTPPSSACEEAVVQKKYLHKYILRLIIFVGLWFAIYIAEGFMV